MCVDGLTMTLRPSARMKNRRRLKTQIGFKAGIHKSCRRGLQGVRIAALTHCLRTRSALAR